MWRLEVKNDADDHSLMDLSFSNIDYRYLSITSISGVHVYTQNNDKIIFRGSAIILKNISQYRCMYSNRIYIEKFYCTYISSECDSTPQLHDTNNPLKISTEFISSIQTPTQPMQNVPCILS